MSCSAGESPAEIWPQPRLTDPDALARDDEALILGWDPKTESFEVEPMSKIEENGQKRGRSAKASGKPT